MHYQFFDVDIRDGVAAVTLLGADLPAVDEFQEEWLDLLLRLQADRDARVILLSDAGAPLRFGHAVATLSEIHGADDGPDTVKAELDTAQRILTLMHESAKPIVAAVSGEVSGYGLGLLMNADVRLAAQSATFVAPDARTGLLPGWNLTSSLPGCAGPSAALEIMLSGRTLGAEEAAAKGIVDRIVPAEQWPDEAEAFCRRVAEIPQPALRLSKLVMQQVGNLDRTSLLDLELEAQMQCWDSEETRAGLSALEAGRDPFFPSSE